MKRKNQEDSDNPSSVLPPPQPPASKSSSPRRKPQAASSPRLRNNNLNNNKTSMNAMMESDAMDQRSRSPSPIRDKTASAAATTTDSHRIASAGSIHAASIANTSSSAATTTSSDMNFPPVVNFREKPVVAPSVSGMKLDFGQAKAQSTTSASWPSAAAAAAFAPTTTSASTIVRGSGASSLFFRPSKPIEVKSLEVASHSAIASEYDGGGKWDWLDEDKNKQSVAQHGHRQQGQAAEDKQAGMPSAESPTDMSRSPSQAPKRPRDDSSSPQEQVHHPSKKASKEHLPKTTSPITQTGAFFGGTASKERPFAASTTSFAEMARQSQDHRGGFEEMLTSKRDETGAEDAAENKSSMTYAPVPVVTGEEDEMTVFKAQSVVKLYDAADKKWAQKGAGPMHINLRPVGDTVKGRLVVRHRGTFAVVMNVPVFPEMSVRLVQERTLLLGAIEEGKIVTYACQMENADIAMQVEDMIVKIKDPVVAKHFWEFGDGLERSYPASPEVPEVGQHAEEEYNGQEDDGESEQHQDEYPDSEGDFDTYEP